MGSTRGVERQGTVLSAEKPQTGRHGPRSVRARVVIVEGGRAALIRRVRDGNTYYLFPGGGVEAGETPELAAVREASEELGVEVELEGVVLDEAFDGVRYLYFAARVVGGVFGSGTWPDHAERDSEARKRAGTYEAVWLPLREFPRHDVRPPELAGRLAAGYDLSGAQAPSMTD